MSDETKGPRHLIKPFNGEKYSIWKFRMRALIAEEDALCVLDKDPPTTLTDEWKKHERVAKGLIVKHLTDTMVGFAKEEDTAKEIIAKLDAIYQRASLATQLSTEKRMFSLKFKEDMPLAAHFIILDVCRITSRRINIE